MRKTVFLILVASMVLVVASCNKDGHPSKSCEDYVPEKCETSPLTVRIAGTAAIKSTAITDDYEASINNLQVFVFRGDALDAYGCVDGSEEITLSATNGSRNIYALINAPDLSNVKTRKELLQTTSLLSNDSNAGFNMIGSKDVTLPQSSAVSIDVSRIVSKISIKNITRDFTSSALANMKFTIEEIFIENVVGDINYGLDAQPTIWFNKQGYNNELPVFTFAAPNVAIDNGDSYKIEHKFFAYPNNSDDSTNGNWSARHTRLVVKATLGDEVYYYPVTLPALEANKYYEIENLTITRPGSKDPDKPVTFQNATFDINVLPWNVVIVTDGITI